jgi:hypothetical protein
MLQNNSHFAKEQGDNLRESSKFQVPEKSQIHLHRRFWSLEFLWDLELGI